MRSFIFLPLVVFSSFVLASVIKEDATNAQRLARGAAPAPPRRLFDPTRVQGSFRPVSYNRHAADNLSVRPAKRSAAPAPPGATGSFECGAPLGGVPHPACCSNTAVSPDDSTLLDVSNCVINPSTVGTFEGDWYRFLLPHFPSLH